jgi:hypothetical protein
LLTVLVTTLAGVTILRITPHHSYYCCGSTYCWIGSVGVLLLTCKSLLLLGDVSMTSSALLNVDQMLLDCMALPDS